MKIISKAATLSGGDKNPFVQALLCPLCGSESVVMDKAILLHDSPAAHVNLGQPGGPLVTAKATCEKCKHSFLWRMMLHPKGTYVWTDVMITDDEWNGLIQSNSQEQLPCMCKKCVKEGAVKPAAAPLVKAGQVTKIKGEKESKIIQDYIDNTRMLSDQQIKQIMESCGWNTAKIAETLGTTEENAWEAYVRLIEAYVRIRFVTFQPKESDDPSLPPAFPSIVPKVVYVGFQTQKICEHMCQYLIMSFAGVDRVLGRPDLPASIIYHHMCGMCKVAECNFHPSKRKDQ